MAILHPTRALAIAIIVDVTVFMLLISIHIPLLLATIISTSLGGLISMSSRNRHLFRSIPRTLHHKLAAWIVTLSGLWLVQPPVIWVVQQGLLVFMNETFALLVAKCTATLLTLLWNIAWHKRQSIHTSDRLTYVATSPSHIFPRRHRTQ